MLYDFCSNAKGLPELYLKVDSLTLGGFFRSVGFTNKSIEVKRLHAWGSQIDFRFITIHHVHWLFDHTIQEITAILFSEDIYLPHYSRV